MTKIKLLAILFCITLSSNLLFSEDINFFTKVFFSDAQFWEAQHNRHGADDDEFLTRKVFSNLFSGGIGVGLEFIIWDNTKARGSRLFFKTSADIVFSGLNYSGFYYDRSNDSSFQDLNINGGLFLTGIDWDFYIGGTFPKTDLLWGFGCIWNFSFPAYSPEYNTADFVEKFHFYAVPSVLIGYDIIIPNTKFKITPQIRAGFTCNPLIADDITDGSVVRDGKYSQNVLFSGPYFDFSLAFTFASVKWKK